MSIDWTDSHICMAVQQLGLLNYFFSSSASDEQGIGVSCLLLFLLYFALPMYSFGGLEALGKQMNVCFFLDVNCW